VDALPSSRHVKVEINGTVVADTSCPVLLFETGLPVRDHIPREDVPLDLLVHTDHTSGCPCESTADYWSRQGEADADQWSRQSEAEAPPNLCPELSPPAARSDRHRTAHCLLQRSRHHRGR
jgi:uncharacterized protein (DUF427 family)